MGHVGLVVIAHGTVDSLDDLPAFLTNIRRGHAPPPELLEEVTRRYRAIGGSSPLNATTREVARKLAIATGLPARACGRLFGPYPADAVRELVALGVTDFVVVPLAQHSAPLYVDAVRKAVNEILPTGTTQGPANWGQNPLLLEAFATRADDALAGLSTEELATTTLVWSAHSLPVSVVRGTDTIPGDPYESEVRTATDALLPRLARAPGRSVQCFQSQGMSQGAGGRTIEWLGPDLRAIFEAEKALGQTRVVVAPVGFLADHVEILYDLDIEARAMADTLSLSFSRTASLNADDALLRALVDVITPLLADSTEADTHRRPQGAPPGAP